MIPKFEDFLKEGFLSKTYDRYRTGEDRLEDKIITNISKFKEIDMGFPFVFADIDLEVNGNDKFTWDEIMQYQEQINKTGWRMVGWCEFRDNFMKSRHLPSELSNDLTSKYEYELNNFTIYIKSKITKNTLEFFVNNKYGQNYWCIDDYVTTSKYASNNNNTQRVFRVSAPEYGYKGMILSCENESVDRKVKVRLVKDK